MALYAPLQDPENNQPLLQPTTYNPLEPELEPGTKKYGNGFKLVIITFSCILIMLSVVAFMSSLLIENNTARTRSTSFAWTKDMLSWQMSGYHLQTKKNWMSDPDGPLYHKGYYHIFYQYNPDGTKWDFDMRWKHSVSKDLIHWEHLPPAIIPTEWYETWGAWSGSATILPDGNLVMLYSGETKEDTQVVNLAYPANISDPLLIDWVKYPGNPILTAPVEIGVNPGQFRDPSTAWVDPDGVWRFMMASKIGRAGIALTYKTRDFKNVELEGILHSVNGTGLWECMDLFPMSLDGQRGHDSSDYGPGLKHFLKASIDEMRYDDYTLGTYDRETQKFIPDNPEMDVGIGLRLDYGRFYASKSFYDPAKKRRILWGYSVEADTQDDDLLKGWACMMCIPRVVTYDAKTGTHVLQWPVEEIESLRKDHKKYDNLLLHPGSIIKLNITSASQLDISVEFMIDQEALNKSVVGDDVIDHCESAIVRQALGPFGLIVLADDYLSELTPIYFYIAKASDGTLKKWFCTDQSRSSKALGVDKKVHGGEVPVLDDENYNIRVLVDHSIVEAFGQGGRTCVTSRLYPTRALDGNARVFLFNNGTDSRVKASINVWKLDSI